MKNPSTFFAYLFGTAFIIVMILWCVKIDNSSDFESTANHQIRQLQVQRAEDSLLLIQKGTYIQEQSSKVNEALETILVVSSVKENRIGPKDYGDMEGYTFLYDIEMTCLPGWDGSDPDKKPSATRDIKVGERLHFRQCEALNVGDKFLLIPK